jgi:hypothetical protein
MQDPVVRPAKAKRGEQMIGIADKIAISEKHEFDQIVHRRAARFGHTRAKGPLREISRTVLASS